METAVPFLTDRAARRNMPRSFAVRDGDLHCAGQFVAAGTYREVEGCGRTVVLSREDYLPASLDGRVACYERVGSATEPIAAGRERTTSATADASRRS